MKTSDEQQRAQEILNNADERTADLLYEMWTELVRHENAEINYNKMLDYWKIRTGAAEERINRALFAARLDMNLTAGEQAVKKRILDALKSKINDYSPAPLDPVDLLLTAITDQEVSIPEKMKSILETLDPDNLIEALINQGWFLNPKLSQEAPFLASVLVSTRGTQIAIPLETTHPEYLNRMLEALDGYAEEIPYM